MVRFLRKIETHISLFEKYVIVFLFSSMVILSFGGVLLRNLGISTPAGISSILQYLVLWVAFIGGSLASRENKQVNINLITTILVKYPKLSRIVNVLINMFVVPVSLALFYGAYTFVKIEYEWGIDEPSLGMPSWIFDTVLLYAFMVISFKYFVRLLEALTETPFPEEREYYDWKSHNAEAESK